MDEKKTQKFRQRLLEEYQKLIRSINRNRLAEEEIKLENTEDEGDLATISHNKELLYNLHESDFQRLKSIQEALKYGWDAFKANAPSTGSASAAAKTSTKNACSRCHGRHSASNARKKRNAREAASVL